MRKSRSTSVAGNHWTVSKKQLYVLSILALIILSVYIIGIINAWLNPVTGYELNIYAETPVIFWIAIVLGMIFGSLLYLGLFRVESGLPKVLKYFGLSLLVLSSVSLATLCFIRGYFSISLNDDAGTHLANLIATINNGVLPSNEIYPAMYGELSILSQLSSLSPLELINYSPTYILFIFIFFSVIFCRLILPNYKYSLVLCLILPLGSATGLALGIKQFTPMQCSLVFLVQLIIMITLLFMRDSKVQKTLLIALILSSLVLPFIHPLALFAYVAFLISVLFYLVITKSLHQKFTMTLLTSGLVSVFSFLLWSQHSKIWTVAQTLDAMLFSDGEIANTISLSMLDTASSGFSLGYSLFDYFLMVLIPGALFALVPLSIILYILLIKKSYDNRNYLFEILVIYIILLLSLTFIIFFSSQVNLNRFFMLFGLISFVSFGMICQTIPKLVKKNKNIVKTIFLVIFIVFFVMASVPLYYASPLSQSTSNHNSPAGYYVSSDTTIPTLNRDYNTYVLGPSLVLDRNRQILHPSAPKFDDTDEFSIYHFGYNNYDSLADSLSVNTYLYVTEMIHNYYVEFRPSMAQYRYLTDDFIHLEYDSNVDVVYNNGEVGLYLIIV